MNVLITDGDNRSALAATRSLGRKGHRVVVTGRAVVNLASSSKYCRQRFSLPDPLSAGEDYLKALCEITEREDIDVLFPMTEQSIYLLNQVRNRLPGKVVLACPPAAMMRAASDKAALFQLAESMQVPIPKTIYLTNAKDLPARLDQIERYPVVVKPALSKRLENGVFLEAGVQYAKSRDELVHLYTVSPALRYPSMIQEKIVGPGTGLFTLYGGDRHLALFSHQRVLEKPPSGGVSVVCESVPLDEEMVEAAGRLLSAMGWVGVAMVEFKRDQRDGKAKLMEINGRFWGSLQLSVTCGVDFPVLLLDQIQGTLSEPTFNQYKVGHRMKWFFGTLDHLLIRLKNNNEKINLPPGHSSKVQAVFDFLKVFGRDTSFDVFDWRDIKPFVFEARSYLRPLLRVGR